MALNSTVIRDQNRIPIWWGVSSTDGITLVPIAVDSTTGKPVMEFGTAPVAVMSALPQTLPRDGNRIPCIGGVANDGSGTIIPVSVNPNTGAILAQTS